MHTASYPLNKASTGSEASHFTNHCGNCHAATPAEKCTMPDTHSPTHGLNRCDMLVKAAAHQPWEPSVLHNPWVGHDGAGAACCSSGWLLKLLSITKQISRSSCALQEVWKTGPQSFLNISERVSTVVLTITPGLWPGTLAHHCRSVYTMFHEGGVMST